MFCIRNYACDHCVKEMEYTWLGAQPKTISSEGIGKIVDLNGGWPVENDVMLTLLEQFKKNECPPLVGVVVSYRESACSPPPRNVCTKCGINLHAGLCFTPLCTSTPRDWSTT